MTTNINQMYLDSLEGDIHDRVSFMNELEYRLRMNTIPYELYSKLKLQILEIQKNESNN